MTETIISIFLGIGLAAAAGFRVFLPLFVLSVATHYGYVPVGESFVWIGSIAAIVCLGVATLVEIMAYYIPFIDNLLDTIAIPLATIAGTMVMASTLVDLNPMITWGLAIVAGGGTAATITSSTAVARATSTAATGGFGNNIVTSTETATASIVSALAIFAPILAFIIVLLIIFVGIRMFKKLFSR